jgi:hypothetical protein
VRVTVLLVTLPAVAVICVVPGRSPETEPLLLPAEPAGVAMDGMLLAKTRVVDMGLPCWSVTTAVKAALLPTAMDEVVVEMVMAVATCGELPPPQEAAKIVAATRAMSRKEERFA